MTRRCAYVFGAAVGLIAVSVLAQESFRSLTPPPQTFGLLGTTLAISEASFAPRFSTTAYALDISSVSRFVTGGPDGAFDANLSLPNGAHLDQVTFEVFDNDVSNDVIVTAISCSGTPAGNSCALLAPSVTSSGTPGWVYLTISGLNVTIDNLNNSYALEVGLFPDGGQTKFRRAVVYYHLQVSPAPGTATFNDVPISDFAFQFIEAFSKAGITVGCNVSPPQFCPDRNVTRREMAVFFAKALGLQFQ